jgi:hypothetical protein
MRASGETLPDNGDFGFDWRNVAIEGVVVTHDEQRRDDLEMDSMGTISLMEEKKFHQKCLNLTFSAQHSE